MADAPARDTQAQLSTLKEEEKRIMRELRDLDRKADAETEAKRRRKDASRDDPEAALSALLLECEKEVREAKAYIADDGPPLKIVRVRQGETAPKGATYLSKPKGTGVDFTVPVTLKAYTDVVKRPIFLNQIRDKMRNRVYSSSEDYMDDMRLLTRNTATFNRGPELSWVVQHARYLLEAAEDAILSRRRQFYELEDAMRQQSSSKQRSTNTAALSAVGKRKRATSGVTEVANGDSKTVPGPGASIEVYWPNYRRWFVASVTDRVQSNVHVVYEEDGTDQWIDLERGLKWRVRNQRAAATTPKAKKPQEVPAVKKRRSSAAASSAVEVAPIVVPDAVSPDELQVMKDDLMANMDGLRGEVRDQLSEHLDRIDEELAHGHVLQRVLLAVQDSQASLEALLGKMMDRISNLEKSIATASRGQQAASDWATNGGKKQSDETKGDARAAAADGRAQDTPAVSGAVARSGTRDGDVIGVRDVSTDKRPGRESGENSKGSAGCSTGGAQADKTDGNKAVGASSGRSPMEEEESAPSDEVKDVEMNDADRNPRLSKPSSNADTDMKQKPPDNGEEEKDEGEFGDLEPARVDIELPEQARVIEISKDLDGGASNQDAKLGSETTPVPTDVQDEINSEKANDGEEPREVVKPPRGVDDNIKDVVKSADGDKVAVIDEGESSAELSPSNEGSGRRKSPSLSSKKVTNDENDGADSDSGDSDGSDSDSSDESKSDDGTEQKEMAVKKPAGSIMFVEKKPPPSRPRSTETNAGENKHTEIGLVTTGGDDRKGNGSSSTAGAKVIEVSSDGEASLAENRPEKPKASDRPAELQQDHPNVSREEQSEPGDLEETAE